MFLSSKFDFWRIFKVDPFSKKSHYIESSGKIGVSRNGVPIIKKKKLNEKTKILLVAD